MVMARRTRNADLALVEHRIDREVRNPAEAERLKGKVRQYVRTRNPADDLTPSEAAGIYRDEDFGEEVALSNKRDLDIEWSGHAEYRSDLRDVKPDAVNEAVRRKMRVKLDKGDKLRGKDKLVEPGLGTMVVDYDLTTRPADADVVTVWAREAGIAVRVAGAENRRMVMNKTATTLKQIQDALKAKGYDRYVKWVEVNPQTPGEFVIEGNPVYTVKKAIEVVEKISREMSGDDFEASKTATSKKAYNVVVDLMAWANKTGRFLDGAARELGRMKAGAGELRAEMDEVVSAMDAVARAVHGLYGAAQSEQVEHETAFLSSDRVAAELVKEAKGLVAGPEVVVGDPDPMVAERVGGLYMALEKWVTQTATSRPPGAPIVTQLLESLGKVRDGLRGKGSLHGREAVEAMIQAMSGLFTVDAPPLKRLWRKYGDEVEQMLYKYRIL